MRYWKMHHPDKGGQPYTYLERSKGILRMLAVGCTTILVVPSQCRAKAGDAEQTGKGKHPTPQTTSVPVQQKNGTTLHSDAAKEEPYEIRVIGTPKKDAYDKASVWLNCTLVLVGIGGIIMAVFTLLKIERQTKAAETSIQAMVAAERAWVVISVDSIVPGEFRFWATNEGKTPARVVSIWATNISFKRGEKSLPVPSDEETSESLLQFPPCLIPPAAKKIVWQCTVAEFQKSSGGGEGDASLFSRGFSAAYIYGRIRYFDVLDTEAIIPHESRWLYWLVPFGGGLPFPNPLCPQHNTYT